MSFLARDLTRQVIYVPDFFRDVVSKVAVNLGVDVYFDAGRYVDVTRNLQIKDGGTKDGTRDKYPLVWLVKDFEERFGEGSGYCTLPNVQIIIATSTQMNYTEQQRRDKTFTPILYPIYAEFMYQLTHSKLFTVPLPSKHSKIDRSYWGGNEEGDGKANLFNDFIDAIQIKNLKASVMQAIC